MSDTVIVILGEAYFRADAIVAFGPTISGGLWIELGATVDSGTSRISFPSSIATVATLQAAIGSSAVFVNGGY